MAFQGKAVYDSGNWDEIAEDVSDLITMISPKATPLLDRLPQPRNAAQSVLHEWLEESLNPNTVVSSTAADTTGTAIGAYAADSGPLTFLRAGTVIKNKTTGEFMQVSADTTGNTISVTRGFGGSTEGAITAADQLFIVSDAKLEGFDVARDIARPRTRVTNYCQIFGKDIIVSGTEQAVNHLGGIGDEYEHQKMLRMTESLRDLEKAVIQGKLSGNTIGSSTAYRTMKGLWDFVATNATSTGTLTASILDNIIKTAWDEGAEDLDLIIVDGNWKKLIDTFNTSRTRTANEDEKFKNLVSYYEGSFGSMPVMLNRWMPSNSLLVISTERVSVVPLKMRDFHHEYVAKTGDATKGMVVGEYCLEVRNELGLSKAYG